MKIKIQILESCQLIVWKRPIDINTEDYPQLEGMTKEEAIEYISKNPHNLQLHQEGLDMEWSLFDELMDQNIEIEKEKNYESKIIEWRP